MDFLIGLVCGTCDRYSPLGSTSCPECGCSLSLDQQTRSLTPFPTTQPGVSAPPVAVVEPLGAPLAQTAPKVPTIAPARNPALADVTGASAKPPRTPLDHTFEGPPPVRATDDRAAPRPAVIAGAGFAARKLSATYDSTKHEALLRPRPITGTGAPREALPPVRPEPELELEDEDVAVPLLTPTAGPGIRRPLAPDLPLAPPVGRSSTPAPRRSGTSDPARRKPPSYAHLTQEELMDQARHYLCWQCFTPVPTGHKFCGRCGAEVPPEIMSARTMFFSDMQNPAKARVVLIRGEGMDGLSYHLKMEQHIIGRRGHIEFPEDPFVSPKHANLFYREGKLIVRDEGSLNGVFIRVRGSVDISPGDTFLAGEQAFRLDLTPKLNETPDNEGTMFYGSPKAASPFRISQILQGGAYGMTVCARTNVLQLGREGGDLNFPADVYMSGSHCRIEENNGRFTLTDLNSRNGTYVRIKSERELGHGDYLFVGRKLLRVELNA